MKPVHYLIKHEEVLPHQKHDSHQILADYGTDQVSKGINNEGNDIVVKPLNSFLFKSLTPFQTKIKTPKKKNSLVINNLFYSTIPLLKVMTKNIFTLEFQNTFQLLFLIKLYTKKPKSIRTPESTSATDVQTNPQSSIHCSHIITFDDPSFFKYKNYFQGFFLPTIIR